MAVKSNPVKTRSEKQPQSATHTERSGAAKGLHVDSARGAKVEQPFHSPSPKRSEGGRPRSEAEGADFLFAPVGAFLTLRDRGTEIYSGLVDKGRKAEPRIRREMGKVRERVEGLDLKVPEWVRLRLENSTGRARKAWEDLNLPETLKNLQVRGRVEKLRSRIQGLVG